MDDDDGFNLIDENDLSNEDTDNNEMEESYPQGGESLESASVQRKKVRKQRQSSKCWQNFKRMGGKRSDGKNVVQCIHCGKHYVLNLGKNGTNTMLRHMRVCSKTPGSTPRSTRKLDMLVFREIIVVAIIEHDLPYSFVEYRRIREAFAYANLTIEFWSRNTAAADVYKIFLKEKEKLKETLTSIPSRVCLTTDLWRAITVEGYLCLTAHYIDADWNLRTKILSFCGFPPPHTGIAIALKLIELFKEWELEKKVFSLTVDNASSNDNMQGIIKRKIKKDLVCNGEFFHVRCSAHILNLIVQDGLALIGDALQKIRDSIKFVKASESREDMFQSCIETVGIQERAGLVLDVTTRWNSTHLMLSRAIKYKDALRNLSEVEPSYRCFPSDLEWRRGALICDFLSPFAEMSNLISGSSYPTANLYFMQVWKIESWLRAHEDSEDEIICDMVVTMKLKFDKYWEKYSNILAIVAVLDPRFKFTFLEYCFTILDPSTSKSKLSHVRSKMFKLFEAYKKSPQNTIVLLHK